MKLYKYGLSNTLEEVAESLANALDTTDKHKKTRYISEAYGMIKAMDFLIDDYEDEEIVDNDT